MKKFILLVLLALMSKANGQGLQKYINLDPASTIEVGENVSIPSNTPQLAMVEPHISVHPAAPDHLLVAAMTITNKNNPYESARLVSFVSEDAGGAWQQTDHDYYGYDPWTAILPNGCALLSWLGQPKKFTGQMPICIFFSDNGGKNWKPRVQHIPGEYDGTKMAVDYKHHRVSFTAAHFDANMDVHVYYNQSQNGQEFDQPQIIKVDSDHLRFAEPAILSDGTIVIPIQEEPNGIYTRISSDGGKTFSDRYLITRKVGAGKGYFAFTADVKKDRLYFVRAAGVDTYDGIWINHSSDKGKSWSPDLRVDLFKNEPASKAMVPNAAVNRFGVLGISWIDEQTEAGKKDVYFTISKDGGTNFQRPVRITTISSNPATSLNEDVANKFPGGGHYNSMACKSDGSFQLVWADSRSGVFQLQTCNVKVKL